MLEIRDFFGHFVIRAGPFVMEELDKCPGLLQALDESHHPGEDRRPAFREGI